MFVKYNGVLRGLRSESPFLRNSMIQLCCPAAIFMKYIGDTPLNKLFLQPVNWTLSFDEALRSLNKYTTTLHAINSAIIKLGKLTKANKVYRGISGMALPDEFWKPNEFDVRGGIESAFMSTTLEREVAMGYAAGDGSQMGIVLEMQQGMVNRGADISWLSQYPHEREILFGPLTGIEVLGTRNDSLAVVIECAFSINLSALTLEQVVSKRRKVVMDMDANVLADFTRSLDKDEAWTALGEFCNMKSVSDYLKSVLEPLHSQGAEYYNDDAKLGGAINDAVFRANAVRGWAGGLQVCDAVGGRLRVRS